jgi:glycerol 2-dehydrogenase (NADP+)
MFQAGSVLSVEGYASHIMEVSSLGQQNRKCADELIPCSTLGGDSEIARSHILGHEIFTRIAQKYHQNAGSVPLSWAVQRGVTVIPKSNSKERIKENNKLFVLEDDDMAKINAAHKDIGLIRTSYVHDQMWVEVDGVQTLKGWTPFDLGWVDGQGNWLM